MVPLTAFAASAFFRHDRRGIVAGLLYVVYGAAFPAHDMHSASPEVLMLLSLSAALVAASGPAPGGSTGALRARAGGRPSSWRSPPPTRGSLRRGLVRADHWDLLMSDLERSRPTFVVDTAPSGLHGWDRYPLEAFPRLETFVKTGYDPVDVLDGVWLWRRKGCAVERRATD